MATAFPADFFQQLLQALTQLERSQDILPTLVKFLPQFEGLLGVQVHQQDVSVFVLPCDTPGLAIQQEHAPFVFDYVFSETPAPAHLTHLNAWMAAVLRLDQSYRQMETLAREKEQEAYTALQSLRQTQSQWVDAEKMGALGGLVAGMAHELNTPLGIGVTAVSALQDDLAQLQQHFEAGTLSRQTLQQTLGNMQEATGLLHTHMQEAVALIDDFKRVAPRHTHDHLQRIDLCQHLSAVVEAHRADVSSGDFAFHFEAPEHFELITYPRVWAQILHELLKNSQHHGFLNPEHPPQVECVLAPFVPPPRSGMSALLNLMDHRLTGQEGQGVSLAELPQASQARFVYRDNGQGVAARLRGVLFEPFSTRSPAEYSGLGLYMVYNLVHQKLGGEIHVLQAEQGLQLEIRFPLSISEPET